MMQRIKVLGQLCGFTDVSTGVPAHVVHLLESVTVMSVSDETRRDGVHPRGVQHRALANRLN